MVFFWWVHYRSIFFPLKVDVLWMFSFFEGVFLFSKRGVSRELICVSLFHAELVVFSPLFLDFFFFPFAYHLQLFSPSHWISWLFLLVVIEPWTIEATSSLLLADHRKLLSFLGSCLMNLVSNVMLFSDTFLLLLYMGGICWGGRPSWWTLEAVPAPYSGLNLGCERWFELNSRAEYSCSCLGGWGGVKLL